MWYTFLVASTAAIHALSQLGLGVAPSCLLLFTCPGITLSRPTSRLRKTTVNREVDAACEGAWHVQVSSFIFIGISLAIMSIPQMRNFSGVLLDFVFMPDTMRFLLSRGSIAQCQPTPYCFDLCKFEPFSSPRLWGQACCECPSHEHHFVDTSAWLQLNFALLWCHGSLLRRLTETQLWQLAASFFSSCVLQTVLLVFAGTLGWCCVFLREIAVVKVYQAISATIRTGP